jgi:hypothetical protein
VAALVVLGALVFWAAVFAVFFVTQETTPLEFLLGRYEPLPDNLNRWLDTGLEQPSGLLREERLLLPPGRSDGPLLLRQVRYRDPKTRAIVRVCPEERVPRRRISSRERPP